MSDETKKDEEALNELSRRDFVAMGIAAGIVAAAGAASAADMPVTEKDVEIKTADGTCNAAYIHPTTGSHAAVIIWSDAFGLRPVMRQMGRRLAAQGYTVLVPNPYYRVSKDPAFNTSTFSFQNQEDRAKLTPLMGSINAAGAAETDAKAFVAWLDQQKEVNKSKKVGTQGYCMGGPLVMRTAAAVPDRVGAVGSFHGGGLVTDQPSSPHLLASKMHAKLYIGIAKNDDARQPDAKDKLKQAFDGAAKIEVYPADHGWCISDMPLANGQPIYDKPEAERAWTELLALYKGALA
ncbi:MAG TPA: dienelactone hydrolase family protein [Vicinamibacterales bacterium]|nr:dienelactone hydrolase family protein [Vicinamibacterales bacterium]